MAVHRYVVYVEAGVESQSAGTNTHQLTSTTPPADSGLRPRGDGVTLKAWAVSSPGFCGRRRSSL
jgi:hypothetical protein